MLEKVWVHIPRKHRKQLARWEPYVAYETESLDMGQQVAYRLTTGTQEHEGLLKFLKESEICFEIFRREHSFTEKELNEAEILQLIVDNIAEKHDSPLLYVKPNMAHVKCTCCGNIIPSSKSKLAIDYRRFKKDDISRTYSPVNEIIVSAKLKQILLANTLTGLDFAPIYQLKTNKIIKNYFKLVITEGIGEIVPPSIAEKGSQCNVCGFYDKFLCKTLLYFSRKNYTGLDICLTHNWFGGPPIFAGQRIIISSRFYKTLKGYRIKGFSVKPAFFVD